MQPCVCACLWVTVCGTAAQVMFAYTRHLPYADPAGHMQSACATAQPHHGQTHNGMKHAGCHGRNVEQQSVTQEPDTRGLPRAVHHGGCTAQLASHARHVCTRHRTSTAAKQCCHTPAYRGCDVTIQCNIQSFMPEHATMQLSRSHHVIKPAAGLRRKTARAAASCCEHQAQNAGAYATTISTGGSASAQQSQVHDSA